MDEMTVPMWMWRCTCGAFGDPVEDEAICKDGMDWHESNPPATATEIQTGESAEGNAFASQRDAF
ncbi:hypothetical protein [Actinomadura atramentaria]|uniref:hypothetical protein n=1 Tax=Actinomadura atramentaria TaxID=1990 RepID=UPI0012F7FDB4|nr:hypothetical protein [Actinomadura atramentaria]